MTITMTEYGALPAVRIGAAGGAEAIVTLYGAHLISWKTGDGRQRLFCSGKSALDGSRAIRGGVPVIFPQFAERGSGMRHGFARVSSWRLGASSDSSATFTLTNADLAQDWPHGFALALTVALEGDAISMALAVTNTGRDAFAFSSALHSYFLVDDVKDVRIGGVQHGELQIDDKLDQIYRGIDGAMTLRQPSGTLALAQSGFRDAVVWNPGAADTAALADMEDDEYLRFVCMEPALIEPATLVPGAAWHGTHRISAAA